MASRQPKIKRRLRNARFEIYKDDDGEYWWHFKAANGKIQAVSGEGYGYRQNCHTAMLAFIRFVAKLENDKEARRAGRLLQEHKDRQEI